MYGTIKCALFYQALVLTNNSRRQTTVGEIVNLMSVDAQKLQEAPSFLHMLWSGPLTVAVALYFLWQQLGAAVLAGLTFLIILVPINGVVAQKSRMFQAQLMRHKDVRLRHFGELLNGMKVRFVLVY